MCSTCSACSICIVVVFVELGVPVVHVVLVVLAVPLGGCAFGGERSQTEVSDHIWEERGLNILEEWRKGV